MVAVLISGFETSLGFHFEGTEKSDCKESCARDQGQDLIDGTENVAEGRYTR